MCLLSQVLRFFFSGASVTHNSRTSPISPAAFKKKGIFHVKKTPETKMACENSFYTIFMHHKKQEWHVSLSGESLYLSTSKALRAKSSNQRSE